MKVLQSNLSFGQAIILAQAGELISREGWNGKGMFVFIRPGDTLSADFLPNVKSLPQSVKDWFNETKSEGVEGLLFTPYFCMKAADDTIVNGWLASQTDMLAQDWCHVKAVDEVAGPSPDLAGYQAVQENAENTGAPKNEVIDKVAAGEGIEMKESEAAKELDPIMEMTLGFKKFREDLDAKYQETRNLLGYIDTPELHSACQSIILAKAWVGKLLGQLGTPSPYANDGNRTSAADIEPTADTASLAPAIEGAEFNLVVEIDTIREKLGEFYKEGFANENRLDQAIYATNPNAVQISTWNLAKANVFTHLAEARFHLGFTLGVIRDLQPTAVSA